jgi:hypothetical protein
METRRGLPGDTHSRYIEAAIGDTLIECLYMPNGNPRAGPVELPLFPSRSPQRDPCPQVGPTVRIYFPPAGSQVRTRPHGFGDLADRVERWPIERLIPYANNPRLHSEADLDKIAASIDEWGWTNPVLVDEQGVLIAGHGRAAAAARLGLKSIPVIVARGWREDQKQAYRLADNELAARASWDSDLLRNELGDLEFSGFDLELTGFEPDRLEDILAGLGSSGLTDPDSTPEVSENPVTQSGDIWLLGDHRIGCGDSTSATDVERVLAGAQPHVMIADPPYRSVIHRTCSRFGNRCNRQYVLANSSLCGSRDAGKPSRLRNVRQ